MEKIILDPVGYFLFRLNRNKGEVELGFCGYKDMVLGKSNKVLKKFSSKNPLDIIEWIEKNKLYSKESHLEYLKKELKRAFSCLKSGKEYIQE